MADLDDALTRQATVDLAPDQIMPPLNEKALRDAADSQALIAHPLGRHGQPEDGGLTIKGD